MRADGVDLRPAPRQRVLRHGLGRAGHRRLGNFTIATGFTLASSANPVFSYLGAASPAATFTVTNTSDGRTLSVAVSASGRVTIGP